MRFDSWWAGFIYFLDILTFQSPKDDASEQTSFLGHSHPEKLSDGPRFEPPSADPRHKIECDYTRMRGWTACSSETDRTCWLRGPNGDSFGIKTNYETDAPEGRLREVFRSMASCCCRP